MKAPTSRIAVNKNDPATDSAKVRDATQYPEEIYLTNQGGISFEPATEAKVPNPRSGEPVARMPLAGTVNFRQASFFGLTRCTSPVIDL
jgi:hypothetical protein